jgi:preprotein translocase subunit SecD
VYEADFSGLAKKLGHSASDKDKQDAMNSLKNAVERRINALGTAEPVIQTAHIGNSYRLIVDLPGEKSIDHAKQVIGKTAELEFVEQDPANPSGWKSTGLGGAQLTRAQVTSAQNTNEPQVQITFNSQGAKLFSDITARDVGKPIGILIDGVLISSPKVNEQISGGTAVITGQFTLQQAKDMAIQLNSGALPVPLKQPPAEEETIGPTLGQESIHQSLVAGVIGLLIVLTFMAFYYRLPGLVADVALLIYAAVTLAIFKGALFWLGIPQITLTLAGVAGFILSIGMAVDANILIFERFKEEVRTGKTIPLALEAGFSRAWTSIRDSNVSTLITCTILFYFGTGSIRGFALTLGIGVLVSMFTAIVVTRTFLRIVLRGSLEKHLSYFAIKPEEVKS